MQKAVQLTRDGHPNKPGLFSSLGVSQRHLFDCQGNLSDLEDSISNLQKAIHFTDDSDPKKALFLINVGDSQMSRFDHLGDPTDSEAAVSAF